MNEKIQKNKELLKKQKEKAEKKTKKAIEDYKKFAIKGNVIDLAVGVAIGSAFTAIVNSIVSSFINPLISLMTKNVDISKLFISLSGGNYQTLDEAKAAGAIVMNYGVFISSIINFLLISIVLFIVLKYINKIKKLGEKTVEKEVKQTTKECQYCKSTINIDATKCAFCTSDVEVLKTETKNDKK